MKRKDFWKGFGVALALVVVLNLAWKPIAQFHGISFPLKSA